LVSEEAQTQLTSEESKERIGTCQDTDAMPRDVTSVTISENCVTWRL